MFPTRLATLCAVDETISDSCLPLPRRPDQAPLVAEQRLTRAVRVVTDATFADVVLGSALPCLVEFRDGAPTDIDEVDWLTSFAGTNGELTCARLDVSSSPQTARTYEVGTVPTYLVFQLGAVVSTAARLEDVPSLLAALVDVPTDGVTRSAAQAPAPS